MVRRLAKKKVSPRTEAEGGPIPSVAIIQTDCQDARQYEAFLKDEKAVRALIERRLRGRRKYRKYAKNPVAKNGSHKKNDPTAEADPGSGQRQTRISQFRARSSGPQDEKLFISLYPGHLLPKLRTGTAIVLEAVGSLAAGGTIRATAAELGVHPRTVSRWIRPLEEEGKRRLKITGSVRAPSRAARTLRTKVWRALNSVTVLVLAKLLAHTTVI